MTEPHESSYCRLVNSGIDIKRNSTIVHKPCGTLLFYHVAQKHFYGLHNMYNNVLTSSLIFAQTQRLSKNNELRIFIKKYKIGKHMCVMTRSVICRKNKNYSVLSYTITCTSWILIQTSLIICISTMYCYGPEAFISNKILSLSLSLKLCHIDALL